MRPREITLDDLDTTDNPHDIFLAFGATEEKPLNDDFLEFEIDPAPQPEQGGFMGYAKRAFFATGRGIKYAFTATGAKLKETAISGIQSIKEGLQSAGKNPISTGVAITAASVNAFNALTAPAGISPEELGRKWWLGMNGGMRFYSIISSVSALSINTIMNARFIPQAGQKLKKSLGDMRKGCGKIILNTMSIFLGLGAGVAQGSIAYSAYLWLPFGTISAVPFALLAAVVTFSGRYLSVKNIISRIMNVFYANARLQHTYADLMDHINPYYLSYLEQELQTIIAELLYNPNTDEPLTEDEYQIVIQTLSEKLHELQAAHPDLIQQKSTKEYIAKYACLLSDVTIALFCSTSGFMTFTQKGFDGVNTIAKLTGNPLDSLAAGWRGLIGANPGLASFMFFGNHGINIRATMTALIIELYQNPRRIPGAMVLLAVNGIGANSMNSVGQSVLKNTNNIFSLTKNALGSTYLTLITFAGASGNGNTIVNSFLAKPETPANKLKICDIAKRLNNADDHPISDETAEALRRNTLFVAGRRSGRAYTPVQDDHTPTSDNTFEATF